ncbi:MAG: Ig-like domain-containing protein [Bacteroidales bacterium]|nr:Ig-like domain-containing protein [Bacteroidales bacterium]
MNINIKYGYLLSLVMTPVMAVMLFSRCAREMTSLTGGPRDTIPPKLVESEPPNYSVEFDSKEIEIEFNEFIQLKEMEQQFLSSPPFEEDPEIKMKGKGIEVELKESLKDSTTYTLNFGNAIVDYTESNPLRNFKYVFSTGKDLDSMRVEGRVYDAFNLKARENVLVMLYEELNDSVPYNRIPDYVSRTDEQGYYSITNVRQDTFKIFALDDLNNNYLYDSQDEQIGFVDSTVVFEKQMIEEHDTIYSRQPANAMVPGDSLPIDTVIHRKYRGYPAENFTMAMFNETGKEQYLKSYQRKQPMKVDFIFNRPLRDSLRFALLDSVERKDWYIKKTSAQGDTVSYWLKDTSLYYQEYLKFQVGYQQLDSMNQLQWTSDTLELSYIFEEGEKTSQDTLAIDNNASKTFNLNQQLRLTLPFPFQSIDTSRIMLEETVNDSVVKPAKFQIQRKERNLRSVYMDVKWKPNTNYHLTVLPQAIRNIYDVYHDTLDVRLKTRAEDYYGSLKVGLPGLDSEFILQLVQSSNDEEQVIREQYTGDMKDGLVTFEYLDPKEYLLKVIFDRNGNKEWDTGDYLRHEQPEKVRYNPEKINIRSNWEYEIDWDVGQKPTKVERRQ